MHNLRGGTPSDYQDLVDLMHTAWPGEPTCHYSNDPYFEWDQFRLVEVDDAIVSMIKIYRREIRWGTSTAIMGGIGDVTTHPDHRGKGYAGMLLEDAVLYMRERGYEISTLFSGLTDFYAKFGWTVSPLPQFRLHPTDDGLCEGESSYRIRKFENDRHLEQVKDIYARYSDGRTGTVVRTSDYWKNHFTWVQEDPEAFLVATKQDDVVAYARCWKGDGVLHITECCHLEDHRDSVRGLLAQIMTYAGSQGITDVWAFVPGDSILLQAASDLGIDVRQEDGPNMMINPITPESLAAKQSASVAGDIFFWRSDAF